MASPPRRLDAFGRDYQPVLRLNQANVELHIAVTQRNNATRIAFNGAALAMEEMSRAQEELVANREETEKIRTAMEQSERYMRMQEDPSRLRQQLAQQQLIGELMGERLGGIRVETVNSLREEVAGLHVSLDESQKEAKKQSDKVWHAQSETALAKANLRGKFSEWEQFKDELRAAVSREKKRADEAENEMRDKSWIWAQEKKDLEATLEQEKGRANSAEAELSQKAESWKADRATLSTAITTANQRASSVETGLQEKSAAWEQLEQDLRGDIESANGHIETMGTLREQLDEVTRERDALETRLRTSTAKIGFMTTHSRKLKENNSAIKQDRGVLAGMVDVACMENTDLARVARELEQQSERLRRDLVVADTKAHHRFQLHIIAAGAASVVAAKAALVDIRGRDTLLSESQASLGTMARERDELAEKLASFQLQHEVSHKEATDLVEETRQALRAQEEKSRVLQTENNRIKQERAQEEQIIHQRQNELTRQEEKLRTDRRSASARLRDKQSTLRKGQDNLAAEITRINGEIAAQDAEFNERVQTFERDEASARDEVKVMYDKVCADEEAVKQAKLELDVKIKKHGDISIREEQLAAREALLQTDRHEVATRENAVGEKEKQLYLIEDGLNEGIANLEARKQLNAGAESLADINRQRRIQELEDKENELKQADMRLLQAKRQLNDAVEKQKRRNENAKIAMEQNEKLVQQAVQRRDNAEVKMREASSLLAATRDENDSLLLQKAALSTEIQNRDATIAEMTNVNTKLTVAVASLSLVKQRPPSTVSSRLPSPQSLRSNTPTEEAASEPVVQDFEFLIGGSTLNPSATYDGPADVIALVQEMKGIWLGLFKANDDLPLAWAQPGTGISCVNKRAHKYNDRVNGGHEGGSDPRSTCRRCRLCKIPCVMAHRAVNSIIPSPLPVILPLPAMFRRGRSPVERAYWVME